MCFSAKYAESYKAEGGDIIVKCICQWTAVVIDYIAFDAPPKKCIGVVAKHE